MNKPVLLLTIAVAAFLPLGTQAQKTDSAKVAGDGKALIADRDNKIWLVSNAETLSEIEGRHVKVDGACGRGPTPNSNHVGERDQSAQGSMAQLLEGDRNH
jgi:hypothetical protein